jgi:hypothetical protein
MRDLKEQPLATLLSQAQADLLKRIQSSRPTRYRLWTASDAVVHVFCANDALLYTLLTNQPVTLEAEPPSGEPFTVNLAPAGPERLDLWQSLVTDAEALPEMEGLPSKRCPYHHLFARNEDAERWHGTLTPSLVPVVQIVPLEQGWQRARAQVRSLAAPESEVTVSCCS